MLLGEGETSEGLGAAMSISEMDAGNMQMRAALCEATVIEHIGRHCSGQVKRRIRTFVSATQQRAIAVNRSAIRKAARLIITRCAATFA